MPANEKPLTYWMLGLAVLAFGGMVSWSLYENSRPKPDADFCVPASSDSTAPATAATVIVLDQTDEVAAQTRAEIWRRVLTLLDQVTRDHEPVSMFVVNANSRSALVPRFAKCRPPRECSNLTQNCAKVRQNEADHFYAPLKAIVDEPVNPTAQSPIAEAIADLSVSGFVTASSTSRLVVFSDLIQNTPQASMFGCTSGEDFIRRWKSTRLGVKDQRPIWKNVQVDLHVIPRAGLSESGVRCRSLFWNYIFGNMTYTTPPKDAVVWSDLPGPVSVTPDQAALRNQ